MSMRASRADPEVGVSQGFFATLGGLFSRSANRNDDDNSNGSIDDDIESAHRAVKYYPSRNMKGKEKGITPDGDLFANKYVKLSLGVTAYYIIDPPHRNSSSNSSCSSSSIASNASIDLARNHVVLCLHGMTNSSYMFRDMAEHLAARMQCQVVAFDFYGRGRSPWTGAPCSLEALVSQTKELLNHLHVTELASVIGYDIGAAVAVGLLAKYYNNSPKIVNNLVLLSPVGVVENEYELRDLRTLRMPVLGELLMLVTYMQRFVTYDTAAQYGSSSSSKAHYPMVRKAMRMLQFQIDNTPGFCGAFLSTLRNFPFERLRELYMVLGQDRSTPICVILGKQDAILPTLVGEESDNITSEVFEVSCERNQIHLLEDAGHHVLFERFDEVMDIVFNFYAHGTSGSIDQADASNSSSSSSSSSNAR